jgi:hypothetical protein
MAGLSLDGISTRGELKRFVEQVIGDLPQRVQAAFKGRIVRGGVTASGAVARGRGFTAARSAGQPTGVYTVTFEKPFEVPPVVTALSTADVRLRSIGGDNPSATGFELVTHVSSTDALIDAAFDFEAVSA